MRPTFRQVSHLAMKLHWFKFTLIAAIVGLAVALEPRLTIGLLAGAFLGQLKLPASK